MSKRRRGRFNSRKPGKPWAGQKGPRGGKARQGARFSGNRSQEFSAGQPMADSNSAVPCPVCGYPVEPSRKHFHMVRFHGAALRPGGP